jgi:hypothetical protein
VIYVIDQRVSHSTSLSALLIPSLHFSSTSLHFSSTSLHSSSTSLHFSFPLYTSHSLSTSTLLTPTQRQHLTFRHNSNQAKFRSRPIYRYLPHLLGGLRQSARPCNATSSILRLSSQILSTPCASDHCASPQVRSLSLVPDIVRQLVRPSRVVGAHIIYELSRPCSSR